MSTKQHIIPVTVVSVGNENNTPGLPHSVGTVIMFGGQKQDSVWLLESDSDQLAWSNIQKQCPQGPKLQFIVLREHETNDMKIIPSNLRRWRMNNLQLISWR